ncbi:hypothetical protein D910_06968 [Dendroctonus ponderosae]|uniref:Uncharacterized protein n=1 Tax=Dendroctonus ponderosae TaxID=77166 RepID=U4UB97_DENPD|nr:hypothetical protein D910_06968 [Dendroctonus ponderosae]KAH1008796.1 hypothetical protein HUJ05_009321 [Dendroctonus ponderosae]
MSCRAGCSAGAAANRSQMMYARPPGQQRPGPHPQPAGNPYNAPAVRQAPSQPSGHHEHHHNEEHMPGRDDLAKHVMEDFGDAAVWNESSAVSLQDFESSGAEEDGSCPPCDEPKPPPSRPAPRATSRRPKHSQNAQELGACAPCEEGENQMNRQQSGRLDSSFDVTSMVNAPSNISVFDAEELNITTAPRNADWDIPRNRIWQTLSSSLDETELQEEDEYLEYVTSIQTVRREFFEKD